MSERNLPFSTEAEQELLGSVLLNPQAFGTVKLSPGDFYHERHQKIWEVLQVLHADDKPADAVTVLDHFDDKDTCAFIIGLANRKIGAYQAKAYAKIVREKSTLRQIIDIGHGVIEQVSSGDQAEDVIDTATNKLIELNQEQQSESIRTMKQVGLDWYEQIEANCKKEIMGVQFGLVDIDKRLGGMRSGELIIMAGRPGTGKSALAGHLATHAAANQQKVLIFSLEMTAASFFERMVCDKGSVNMDVVRNPKQLHDGDWSGIGRAVTKLRELPIGFYDKPIKIDRLCSIAKTSHLKKPVDLVIVDYLQLVDADGGNREQEVANVSRKLKGLSKQLECPVVSLAQLNREVQKRTNKRPNMADLRDSGQIEQDADAIILLYRDQENSPTVCEAISDKVRHGVPGRDCIRFEGQFQRFTNLEHSSWPSVEKKEESNVSPMRHYYGNTKT